MGVRELKHLSGKCKQQKQPQLSGESKLFGRHRTAEQLDEAYRISIKWYDEEVTKN